jgi:3-methyladenine DNA glycosylase AlkC
MADVAPAALRRMNNGEIETASLAEFLSVDMGVLMRAVAPDAGDDAPGLVRSAGGVVQRMSTAGRLLVQRLGPGAVPRFATHASDVVRGWACYMVAARERRSLPQRLAEVRRLADDPNSGVREWAWIALRPHIAADLPAAIGLLEPWTSEGSANLRRYATEITRPRGVWCSHIDALKRDPAPAVSLLEPLRADPTKYVQDSVSNWLNDAAKSQPDWVRSLCARWLKESRCKPTERICRRAVRSI